MLGGLAKGLTGGFIEKEQLVCIHVADISVAHIFVEHPYKTPVGLPRCPGRLFLPAYHVAYIGEDRV